MLPKKCRQRSSFIMFKTVKIQSIVLSVHLRVNWKLQNLPTTADYKSCGTTYQVRIVSTSFIAAVNRICSYFGVDDKIGIT